MIWHVFPRKLIYFIFSLLVESENCLPTESRINISISCEILWIPYGSMTTECI